MTKRPPPYFIADHSALDFLNTIAVPTDMEVEWLGSGDDLLTWLEQAELAPRAVLKAFRKSAVPGELDAVAGQARTLRDWFKPFVLGRIGRPLGADALGALEPLNQLLARDDEYGQIAIRDRTRGDGDARETRPVSALAWRVRRRWHSPESLLFPIARALADLVCNEDFVHVKACEGPSCTLLFIDRTRGHVRRWCSMAICGNRAKQAAHRERAHRTARGKGRLRTARR